MLFVLPSLLEQLTPSKVNVANSLLAAARRLQSSFPSCPLHPPRTRAINHHSALSLARDPTCRKLQLPARMARIRSESAGRPRARIPGTRRRRRGERPECRRARASFRVAENRSTFYVPACAEEGRLRSGRGRGRERVGVRDGGGKGGRKELARFFRAI